MDNKQSRKKFDQTEIKENFAATWPKFATAGLDTNGFRSRGIVLRVLTPEAMHGRYLLSLSI
jgi:hypothetical protein